MAIMPMLYLRSTARTQVEGFAQVLLVAATRVRALPLGLAQIKARRSRL